MSRYISKALRRQVIERAKHRCEYCLVHEDDFYFGGQIDHIQSVKHGGKTESENLAYSCIHCNRNKGSDVASFINVSPVRFFNPRVDAWEDHFSLLKEQIIAKTEIAAVTLKILDMNNPRRLLERAVFIEEGTYPPS